MDKKELGTIIHSVLKPLGFKKKGLVWTLTGEEISERLWLQKSCYGDLYYFYYNYIINSIQERPSETHTYVRYWEKGECLKTRKEIYAILNFENDMPSAERENRLVNFLTSHIVPNCGKITSNSQLKDLILERKWCSLRWTVVNFYNLPEIYRKACPKNLILEDYE